MLYIVRHGQTNYNKEKRCQGHTDIRLNEEGIKQAYDLKEKLKNIKFDKVFCSPLKRACETAKIITDEELVLDDRLIERCNGVFEGKTKDEIDKFVNSLENYRPEDYNVETLDHLQERANDFLDEILPKYKNKNILIVSHGGLIFNLISYFYGTPKESERSKYFLGNCEVFMYNNN